MAHCRDGSGWACNEAGIMEAQRRDYARAARVTDRLHQLAPGDLLQRRDLGILQVQIGQRILINDGLVASRALLNSGNTDRDELVVGAGMGFGF